MFRQQNLNHYVAQNLLKQSALTKQRTGYIKRLTRLIWLLFWVTHLSYCLYSIHFDDITLFATQAVVGLLFTPLAFLALDTLSRLIEYRYQWLQGWLLLPLYLSGCAALLMAPAYSFFVLAGLISLGGIAMLI